jgi:hypothetical protein
MFATLQSSEDFDSTGLGLALRPKAAMPFPPTLAAHRIAVELDDDGIAVAAPDDRSAHQG